MTSPELGGDLHLLDEAGDDHAQAGAAPALLVTEDAGHTGGDLLQDVCNVIQVQALCVECDPGAPCHSPVIMSKQNSGGALSSHTGILLASRP